MSFATYSRAGKMQTESAVEYANALAEGYTKEVEAVFEEPLSVARTLARGVMEGFEKLDPEIRRSTFDGMLKRSLESNPDMIGIWSCWEPDALDGFDSQCREDAGFRRNGRKKRARRSSRSEERQG